MISIGSLLRSEACPRRLAAVVKHPHADRLGLEELAFAEFLTLAPSLNDAESAITTAYNHHSLTLEDWLDFTRLATAVVPKLHEIECRSHVREVSGVQVGFHEGKIGGKPCVFDLGYDPEGNSLARLVSSLVGHPVGTYRVRYKKYEEPDSSFDPALFAEIAKRALEDRVLPGPHCGTCPVVDGCPALQAKPKTDDELSSQYFVYKAASETAKSELRTRLLLKGPSTFGNVQWYFQPRESRDVTDPGRMFEILYGLLGPGIVDFISFKEKQIEEKFKDNLEIIRLITVDKTYPFQHRRPPS